MAALAGHPAVDARDLSSRRARRLRAARPCPAEIARAVGERLPGVVVRLGYGLTETSATVTAPDRELAVAPGSVGRAMPGTELRVVDPESGADLGPGEPGELLGARAADDGGLPAPSGRHGRDDRRRRVAAHRRPRRRRRGRPGRSSSTGSRSSSRSTPSRSRRRSSRPCSPRIRRSPTPPCRAPTRTGEVRWRRRRPRGARRRRPHGLGGGARRALQAHPRGALRRGDPQDALGQDPAPRARARAV